MLNIQLACVEQRPLNIYSEVQGVYWIYKLEFHYSPTKSHVDVQYFQKKIFYLAYNYK
jgi:hypothetical protein